MSPDSSSGALYGVDDFLRAGKMSIVHYSACTGVTSGKLQKLLLGGKYSDMRSILFYVAIALAVIAVAAAVYFYIPGIYHPYISIENGHLVFIGPGRHLHVSTSRHRFYTGACVFLAAVFVIIGFLMRPRKAAVA